jgi:hypothetical protein
MLQKCSVSVPIWLTQRGQFQLCLLRLDLVFDQRYSLYLLIKCLLTAWFCWLDGGTGGRVEFGIYIIDRHVLHNVSFLQIKMRVSGPFNKRKISSCLFPKYLSGHLTGLSILDCGFKQLAGSWVGPFMGSNIKFEVSYHLVQLKGTILISKLKLGKK